MPSHDRPHPALSGSCPACILLIQSIAWAGSPLVPGPPPAHARQLPSQLLQLARHRESPSLRHLHSLITDLLLGLGPDITFVVKSLQVPILKSATPPPPGPPHPVLSPFPLELLPPFDKLQILIIWDEVREQFPESWGECGGESLGRTLGGGTGPPGEHALSSLLCRLPIGQARSEDGGRRLLTFKGPKGGEVGLDGVDFKLLFEALNFS